jgi:hypothetical protein
LSQRKNLKCAAPKNFGDDFRVQTNLGIITIYGIEIEYNAKKSNKCIRFIVAC